MNSLIEMKEPVKQADKLIDIYLKRKNRYYGDINTNELKEEKDDDWVKEIEINEKRPISHKPNSKAKPIKKVNPY